MADNFVVSKTVSSGFNGSQLVPLQGYMYNWNENMFQTVSSVFLVDALG